MGVFLSEGIGDVWIAQQCNEKNGKYSLNGVFTWCEGEEAQVVYPYHYTLP